MRVLRSILLFAVTVDCSAPNIAIAQSTPIITEQKRPVMTREEKQKESSVVSAARGGDLYAAARLNGGRYVMEFDPHNHFGVLNSVEALGEVSELVVVGRAVRTSARLTAGGGDVSTYAVISVEQVIKGAPTQEVTVKVRGGRVRFDDGTEVDVRSGRGEFGMVAGRSYALFLSRVTADDGPEPQDLSNQVFKPTGASQGIFDLTSGNGIVKSQGPPESAVNRAVNNERCERFLSLLPSRALTPPRR
jgi:hypothetical protein